MALVGDCNAWSPTANVANVSPWGTHYWVVLTDAELGAPAGQKYKWWGEPDVWRAPPESTAYAYDTNGQVGFVRPSHRRGLARALAEGRALDLSAAYRAGTVGTGLSGASRGSA